MSISIYNQHTRPITKDTGFKKQDNLTVIYQRMKSNKEQFNIDCITIDLFKSIVKDSCIQNKNIINDSKKIKSKLDNTNKIIKLKNQNILLL